MAKHTCKDKNSLFYIEEGMAVSKIDLQGPIWSKEGDPWWLDENLPKNEATTELEERLDNWVDNNSPAEV